MNVESETIAYLAVTLARQKKAATMASSAIADHAAEVARLSVRLRRYALKDANSQRLSRTEQQDRDQSAKRLAEIADEYGATVNTNGDPRGKVVRFIFENREQNGFGEGFYIA